MLFSEDGRDDYLCAEHYVMLGNWDRDPDRYGRMREIVSGFLRSLYGEETSAETIDAWMNVPENARDLVGTGTPEDSEEGLAQQERLAAWVRLLEDEQRHGERDRFVSRGAAAQRIRSDESIRSS